MPMWRLVELLSVAGHNSSALLASMLQGVEAAIRHSRNLGCRRCQKRLAVVLRVGGGCRHRRGPSVCFRPGAASAKTNLPRAWSVRAVDPMVGCQGRGLGLDPKYNRSMAMRSLQRYYWALTAYGEGAVNR